jgi:hypothetical protein
LLGAVNTASVLLNDCVAEPSAKCSPRNAKSETGIFPCSRLSQKIETRPEEKKGAAARGALPAAASVAPPAAHCSSLLLDSRCAL